MTDSQDPQTPAPGPADAPAAAAAAPGADHLQKERDDYYDRLLRKTAEFDNFRKRVERERKEFTE
jgi:molecular chaperone GrpE (heat shock protein)